MSILIGSRAIKYWFSDFNREPKDWDYIGNDQNYINKKGERIEYHKNSIISDNSDTIIDKDDLYTLKVSHSFWDIKWEKTMWDIVFLKSKGCSLRYKLLYKLIDYWKEVHGENKRSDLKMGKEEFFNNALKTYNHDYLHTLINPNPIYKKVLKEGKEVEVCEEKWKKLTHTEKKDLVFEEIYVMAYERLAGRDYRTAYSWMLKKFIINHAPIWEAIWIVDNYNELRKPSINYKEKLDYELRTNQRSRR